MPTMPNPSPESEGQTSKVESPKTRKKKPNPEADALRVQLADEKRLHEQTRNALVIRDTTYGKEQEAVQAQAVAHRTVLAAILPLQKALDKWAVWPDDGFVLNNGVTFGMLRAVKEAPRG